MKKSLVAIFVLFLSFSSVNLSKAQINQSAPTKEDALNFIRKVIRENPGSPAEAETPTKFDLNGCTLTVTALYYTVSIDLSRVKVLKKNEIGYPPNEQPIYFDEIMIEKLDDNAFVVSKGVVLEGGLMYIYGIDKNNSIIKDNNYIERLMKALDFLIKSCGGGRAKADPASKF